MPTKTKLLIGLIILAAAANFWLLPPSFSSKTAAPQQATTAQKALGLIVDRCSGIADKSVAGQKVRVEFEKLAVEGIKAKVIQDCMNDNGFVQNPAWLKYATPIATANSQKNKISFDEALNTLSRADMQAFAPAPPKPDYWTKK
jgi:hypothetical protein